MEVFSFRTIQHPAEGLYKEKGSKFIGFAFPVQSEEEVKQRQQELRKKYFDARHHCFAYILGADKSRYRAFDDGEPNHSAGDPILGQIRSRNLTDVLVVVIRYFGGVKLGVGGLIGAYKAAAEDALNQCAVIEKEVMRTFSIEYAYSSTPEVMRLVKEFNLMLLDQQFGERCSMKAEVTLRQTGKLLEKITLMNALGTAISISPC